jgi:hypothetical protein
MGVVIEEINDYGNKVAKLDEQGNEQHYPDRSDVAKKGKKFARIDSIRPVAAVAAPVAPLQPQASVAPPPAAPIAAPSAPVTYTPQPAAAMPLVDDEIPW